MNQPPGTTSQDPRGAVPAAVTTAAGAAPGLAADEPGMPRHTTRRDLPHESPGRMVLPNHQSVYVTLHDISRGGCCVLRKGPLELHPEDKVRIEMWREDIQTKASLQATVRWVTFHEGKTKAGLRFVDTSIKTQRTIDQYLQRSFAPGA